MAVTSPPPSSPRHDGADRYVSFKGIDFEGNMRAVLEHLRRYIDDPAIGNAFWDRFKRRFAQTETGPGETGPGIGSNAVMDRLLLLHCHVYYMVELFEEHDDEEALAALKKLEEECF